MQRKFIIGLLILISAVIGVMAILWNEKTLVLHPKGIIAHKELELIVTNIALMLLIIVPTYILLFTILWKYVLKRKNVAYKPNETYGVAGELMMWILPSLVVIALAIITWKATHELNPYKPIESTSKPLMIQVIALDWKWLFIYPELGVATLNKLHIPKSVPIHFNLTADGAPMNSFWIPQLSGQIYAMTGMTTQLYLRADELGEYIGREVEMNGEGYADMTFSVQSDTPENFKDWVTQVKKSPLKLTENAYNELRKPAIDSSILLFSEVEDNLYHKIIDRYMYPTQPVL